MDDQLFASAVVRTTSSRKFPARFGPITSQRSGSSPRKFCSHPISECKGHASPLRLPFFSRVNLRQHAEDLLTMGFPISCACISRALINQN